MSESLYLIETRAKKDYICPACHRIIPKGSLHFRHDPFPAARIFRGQVTTHWCKNCILLSDPGPIDTITKRMRVPVIQVKSENSFSLEVQKSLFAPLQIHFVGIGSVLQKQIIKDPNLLHHITPDEFEELICDRFYAMGLEPKRIGAINRKDGGVDIIFWPRLHGAFPFLGAAQVKHHKNPEIKEGPATVRDFAGTLSSLPFNAGILVTNTSFTPDAEWFAKERAKLLRLRDLYDIRRWLYNNFDSEAEWREIPKSIELCPGVVLDIF